MLHRFGADLVLFAHFLFAAFAVFGGFLCFHDPAWAFAHIPVVLWSSIVNLMGWTCPLTPMEKALRIRAGQTIAEVSKRWFTFNDSYGVDIHDGQDDVLILASTVVIDMVCHSDQKRA